MFSDGNPVKHFALEHAQVHSLEGEGRNTDEQGGNTAKGPAETRTEIDRSCRKDDDFDGFVRSAIARMSIGRSPLSFWLAWLDWAGHLSIEIGFSICRGFEHAQVSSLDTKA